jgi:hypothetical protein
MSLWEFAAALGGFAEFHGVKKQSAEEISDARLAELGIEGFEDG